MDSVLQYEIPLLHPLLVHFPIVLLTLAALACAIWARNDTRTWSNNTILLLLFALVATIAAHVSGDAAAVQAEGVPIVEELVDHHHDMSLFSMIATGISLLAMLATRLGMARNSTVNRMQIWIRLAVLSLVVIAFVLVAYTSHVGGTMVWGVAR